MKQLSIVLLIVLSPGLMAFLLTCTKEKSCEDGCGGTPVVPVDTIPIIDTPKNYFVTYDILIDSFNNSISHIEAQVKRKPEPFFWTYEIINHVDDTISYRYIKTFDVTWIFENNERGDTAVFGYVIVYPGPVISQTFITDTLIK